jgi:PHD/YefM family antitoxin component YafN of YafNO toxin-antitoxin module
MVRFAVFMKSPFLREHPMHTMAVDESLARLVDAAQREPLILQRQERDVAVVLSVTEYERLTRHDADTRELSSGVDGSGRADTAQRALLEETRGLWPRGDGLPWQRALRDEWRDRDD